MRPIHTAVPSRWLLSTVLAGLLLPGPFAQAASPTPNPGLKYYYPAPAVPVVDVEADVVIYGATSGGVVAAAQAVRMGKSVALVAFGRHVGGMTSGGLTETDGVSALAQGGITREYFVAVGSNTGFKPSKAEQKFEALLADPVPGATWDSPVPTFYEQRLTTVEKFGARIVAIHMENGSVFRGKMFIDCTYEGDLLARAGVSHTYGREASSQYGESKAGKQAAAAVAGTDPYLVEGNSSSGLIYNLIDEPVGTTGSGDNHLQAYNFRMYTAQSSNPATLQPLYQPAVYDPTRFELLYRFHRAGGSTAMTVGNDINNHEMFDRGCSTDHIGGNRWPDGSGGWIPWPEADYATRELMYQSHVSWQLGMLWYLKNDARYRALATDLTLGSTIRANIQALLNKVDQLGLALGEYPETGGWPDELYVREARRMISDFVVTQAYFDRTLVAADSVGLANYTADSHHVRRLPGPGYVRVEGDTGGSASSTWRIPYRALVPKKSECENLLVTWSLSASHVAFCSTRMEPCLMVLSQSAATAAALCIDRNEAVQDLPYPLLKLQLLADGQILGTDPPATGAEVIVDNASTSGFSTSGTWAASSSTSGYYGLNYLQDGNTAGGKSATFNPTLPATDTYEVFARWTSDPNRASNVSYEIVHGNGTSTVTTSQKSNGGTWYSLGVYTFNAGSTGNVTVRNTAANGYVIADAIRFLQVTPAVVAGQRVHVLASDPRADETNSTPGSFKFVRDSDDITAALTVPFTITGSAAAGVDYLTLSSQITITANSRSAALPVTPVSNSTAEGTRTVVIGITPDAAYTTGSNSTATVVLRDKPYDAWRAASFPSPNAPGTEPGGDPDADGLINRMEFFLGTDPRDPSGSLQIPSPQLTSQGARNFLSIEFRRQGLARDVVYQVQSSASLQPGSWIPVTAAPATISYDPATGDRTFRSSVDVTGLSQQFLRLALP
ncbi:MAG: FAD-dependent oxidoreductase [Luteolibacter sp.]